VLIVGDVHGCLDELKFLLQKVGYFEESAEPVTVILLGDLVNKGPYSLETVQFANQHKLLCVRGNHDDACLNAVFRTGKFKEAWKEKYNFVEHLSEEEIQYLVDMPLSITLELDPKIYCVHAGMNPSHTLEEQKFKNLLWIRDIILDSETKELVGSESRRMDGQPWASLWKGPEHVFFGHDAKRRLQQESFATGLDTGVCYGGDLTGALIEISPDDTWTCTILTVPAKREYTVPNDKKKKLKNAASPKL